MRTPLLFTLALLTYLCPSVTSAQKELPYGSVQDASLPEWTRLMYGANPDPGEVIEEYHAFYATHTFVRNSHTQYYKRWLRSIARALPPAKAPLQHRSLQFTDNAQWTSLGPWDWDHSAADRSYAPGAAHVYTVEQSLSDPDILYAGTATAGIYKSADHGHNWISVSGEYRSTTVSALEIDHSDPDIVFAELLNSIYKSTNGGENWFETGDDAFKALNMDVNDIVMHPDDTDIVYAATNLALYKSLNAGTTWTVAVSGDFLEIEFHPTDYDTIYAVKHNGDKTEFHRSVNGGTSFQIQSGGWPNPNTSLNEHQRRTEIAVSPDAPDHVFALATGLANGGSGLYGIYKSTDAGETWNFECCGEGPGGPPSLSNPNLMGWNDDGTDDGGQYYYDLAFAVSPTNADSMYVAGVNLWVSGNGGESFVCPAKWSHPHKPNYVHADIHDLRFYQGTHEIWLACDGGIFASDDRGAVFDRRMTGICGTDFWGFGAGYWDGDVMLGGTYHNGTLLKDNNVFQNGWISTDGGDNFRGFVNPGKPRQVYTDYNIKSLSGDRTVNYQTRAFPNKPNATYIVGESSDMLFHPQYYGTWYSGSAGKLWKTTDDGYTFTMLHDFGVSIAAMDISWSNPNVMYVCTWPGWWSTKKIYRTEDGGNIWVDITPTSGQLNGNQWVPYDIAVDANDPYTIWIVRTSMYGDTDLDGYCVYKSVNGGSTWQNISTSQLNDQAFTCIMHQAGTSGVYLGTRESVFYRNASMNTWAWFGNGLPEATFATKLIPYYRKGKLRSGTNHSVWESPFYEASLPIAQPSIITKRHDCLQDTVYFMDHSIVHETNASWQWQFPGGTPSTSTERNPKVRYNAPGIYTVTLTVTDINGTDTYVGEGMIEVRDWCRLDPHPGMALRTNAYPDYAVVPDLNMNTNHFTISAWVRPSGIQTNYAAVVMSDNVACGMNFREGNNTLGYHWGNNGQTWSWDSNLEVQADKWSHVAMVVSPTYVRLYVNGKQAQHNISLPAIDLSTFKIGSYQAWQSRNYKGLIDEVCIWNRSLTQDEIRALRHLTKQPSNDADLHAYYQFNEETSVIYDKANTYDGILNGGATRVRSRAPVGEGVSQSITILLPGEYNFSETGLTISIPLLGVPPLGPVYVSRLNVLPDTLIPGKVPLDNGYWIVNNYGTNLQITPPDLLELTGLSFISELMEDECANDFYYRGANVENGGWSLGSDDDGLLGLGILGGVSFNSIVSGWNQLGQILPVRDSMAMGRPLVAIVQEYDTTLTSRGGSSMAFGMKSSAKGLQLPRYTTAQLQDVPSPAEASVVFVTDKKQIACFDGTSWKLIHAEYIDPPIYTGLGEAGGITLGGGNGGSSSALLNLGSNAGVLVLSSFDDDDLTDIDFPKEGVLVYRTDTHRMVYYDGIDWITPSLTTESINANPNDATQNIRGVRIGVGEKDPNALLHILDSERGFGIPVAKIDFVDSPQAGLIVFDPDHKMICLFDGVGWRKLL